MSTQVKERISDCERCVFHRAKSARVITFDQFNQALTELAPKRFKGKSKEEALQGIYGLIAGKEPANVGVTVSVFIIYCILSPSLFIYLF